MWKEDGIFVSGTSHGQNFGVRKGWWEDLQSYGPPAVGQVAALFGPTFSEEWTGLSFQICEIRQMYVYGSQGLQYTTHLSVGGWNRSKSLTSYVDATRSCRDGPVAQGHGVE